MPITNTTHGFEVSKTLSDIQVKNIGIDVTITAQLFYKSSCANSKYTKLTDTLLVNKFLSLKIPIKDGEYKIQIVSTSTKTSETTTTSYKFDSYKTLLKQLVAEMQNKLCNCPCESCEDCGDNKEVDVLLSKVVAYFMLNHDYYTNYFNLGVECISCKLLSDVNCLTTKSMTNTVVKKDNSIINGMIEYYYTIFYLGEKARLSCCPEVIDNLFRFDEVSTCFKIVDTKCVIDSIVTHPSYVVTDSNLKLI